MLSETLRHYWSSDVPAANVFIGLKPFGRCAAGHAGRLRALVSRPGGGHAPSAAEFFGAGSSPRPCSRFHLNKRFVFTRLRWATSATETPATSVC